MNRVVHFEIGADDPGRVVKFYEDVFGWKIHNWEGPIDYWLITTGEETEPGIDGAIKERTGQDQRVVNTIEVPSVDEYAERITRAGGEIIVPKSEIPGVGYHAYCRDPEGNIFGIIENL
jgi:predicted enzyme related to lactoylglutathione lyase